MKPKELHRKAVSISLADGEVDLLDKIAGETELTRSELIRRLIIKMDKDPKMVSMIKGMIGTSYNVRSDSEKKDGDPDERHPVPYHSEPFTLYDKTYTPEELLRIIKSDDGKWWEYEI